MDTVQSGLYMKGVEYSTKKKTEASVVALESLFIIRSNQRTGIVTMYLSLSRGVVSNDLTE